MQIASLKALRSFLFIGKTRARYVIFEGNPKHGFFLTKACHATDKLCNLSMVFMNANTLLNIRIPAQ